MNKTTEALKMAIEQLHTKMFNAEKRMEAINACKEALESQEQKPFNYGTLIPSGTSTHKNISVVKSQEQEPVAWMHRHEGEVLEFNDFKSCDKCEPLYTHPAQPLSDDEIREVINKTFPVNTAVTNVDLKFARAIEQALKEKNHETKIP